MAQYLHPLNRATLFNSTDFSTERQVSPSDNWGTPGKFVVGVMNPGAPPVVLASITDGVNSLADGIYIVSMTATDKVTTPGTTSVGACCLVESTSMSGFAAIKTNSSSCVGEVVLGGSPAADKISLLFSSGWDSLSIVTTESVAYDVTYAITRFA